jgi:hypothetical protein
MTNHSAECHSSECWGTLKISNQFFERNKNINFSIFGNFKFFLYKPMIYSPVANFIKLFTAVSYKFS